MTIDPKSAEAMAHIVSVLAPKTVIQMDLVGEELVKTVRLILAPLQLTAALQDRLAKYIDRAISQVPEVRRIFPAESISLPVAEKLRFQEETNPITGLYINLLSRAMDGERVGEAHPAFFTIISQLAPDEVVFLKDVDLTDYRTVMMPTGRVIYPTPSEREERLTRSDFSPHLIQDLQSTLFGYEELNQPEMFPVFFEHLQHLGLIEFTVGPRDTVEYKSAKLWVKELYLNILFIRLTSFGRLFLKCCVAG